MSQRPAWPSTLLALVAILILIVSCSNENSANDDRNGDPVETTGSENSGEANSVETTPGPDSASTARLPKIADTSYGRVGSKVANGVRTWEGIPFAAPPVGPDRWKLPQEPTSWKGTRKPTEVEACPQILPVMNSYIGNEDCLYLDVYAPERSPGNGSLPVLVWIHGGGFTVGATSDSNPSALAKNEEIIIVSITYRLGPLGLLGHEGYGKDTGALAIADQIAALQWTQSEIANFGGDPEAVTIAGESAGGMSVCALMSSPEAHGLFHQAIIQSGPCDAAGLATPSEAQDQADELMESLGCESSANPENCLRSKDAQEIIEAAAPPSGVIFGEGTRWWLNQTPNILPLSFSDAIAQGEVAEVPTIGGVTSDEGTIFSALAFQFEGKNPSHADVDDAIGELALESIPDDGNKKEVLAKVSEVWPRSEYDSPTARLDRIAGEGILKCPALNALGKYSDKAPSWVYEFADVSTDFVMEDLFGQDLDLGAFHASELAFVFGSGDSSQATAPVEFDEEQARLSDLMGQAWGSFVKTGAPELDTVEWPQYEAEAGQTLVFESGGARVEERGPLDCQILVELAGG